MKKTSRAVRIRPIEKSDVKKVRSLIKKHLDMNEKWVYKGEPWYYWTLSNLFSETCLVAEKDDNVIGFVIAYKDQASSREIFIEDILIDSKMRRNGLGTRMVSEIIRNAKTTKCKSIWGTIDPKNKASLEFFKSVGFKNKTNKFSSKFVFNNSVKIKEIEKEPAFLNLKGNGKHRCIYERGLSCGK